MSLVLRNTVVRTQKILVGINEPCTETGVLRKAFSASFHAPTRFHLIFAAPSWPPCCAAFPHRIGWPSSLRSSASGPLFRRPSIGRRNQSDRSALTVLAQVQFGSIQINMAAGVINTALHGRLPCRGPTVHSDHGLVYYYSQKTKILFIIMFFSCRWSGITNPARTSSRQQNKKRLLLPPFRNRAAYGFSDPPCWEPRPARSLSRTWLERPCMQEKQRSRLTIPGPYVPWWEWYILFFGSGPKIERASCSLRAKLGAPRRIVEPIFLVE